MIQLYIANKIEVLAQQFAKDLSFNTSVFNPELIITQTSGMEQWLSIQITQNNGSFSNYQFLKPNNFIHQLYSLAHLEPNSIYNTENLKWLIYQLLSDDDFGKQFPDIAYYYQDNAIKKLQLSVKIADLFDQYLLYRQDYISAWNNNKWAKITALEDETPKEYQERQQKLDRHQKWQKWLWNKIKEQVGPTILDKVELKTMLQQKLQEPLFQKKIQKHYQQIALFGLSVITDYHIEIFYQLSRWIDVRLYFLNPAPLTYWYDNISEKFLFYLTEKTKKTKEELIQHIGNELLTNYGRVAKDTFNILFKNDDFIDAIDDSLTQEPQANSLLQKIQNDIYSNYNQEERNTIHIKDLEDGTICISSSYTIVREIEALYNQLLRVLENDSHIEMQDIVVQVIDIDAYTPYIQAVFNNAPAFLPYTIADRSFSGNDTLVGVLESVLDISEDDFTSEKLVQLLNNPSIRQRFDIQNLSLIRDAVKESNIRFGIQGNKEDESYYVSWLFGLEKMILAYAVTGDEAYALENDTTYPLNYYEGSDAEELLRFVAFVQTLIHYVKQQQSFKTLSEWSAYTLDLINDIFNIDKDNTNEYQYIERHLSTIALMEERMPEPIHFDVFKKSFIDALFTEFRSKQFISGKITFCSMIPMRSIPFKWVGMLGLDGDKFPRKENKIGFNLIDIEYKRGDRNTKNNDKYLFLESLLSSRKYFYLSFIGSSVHDNSKYPPSLLVEEIITYISTGVQDLPEGKTVEDYLLLEQPLHSFSKKYFDDNNALISYLESPFVQSDLKKTDKIKQPQEQQEQQHESSIHLDTLIRFFENPFKNYYNQSLQIYYQEQSTLLPDTEIFEMDTLQEWATRQLMVNNELDIQKWIDKAKKTGQLPLSNMALIVSENLEESIQGLKTRLNNLKDNKQEETKFVTIELESVTIRGKINAIYGSKRLDVNVSSTSSQAKYLLRAWIKHLALVASSYPIDTFILSKDDDTATLWKSNELTIQQAKDYLQKMVLIYQKGQNEIIPFSPKSGLYLAQQLKKKKTDKDIAINKALDNLKKEGIRTQYNFVDLYIEKALENHYFDSNLEQKRKEIQQMTALIYTPILSF